MSFQKPVPGLVIRYSYLWHSEHVHGREEGAKDRPCAVILVTHEENGNERVTVLPITHSEPSNLRLAIEIPRATKTRLGLDVERSWVVLSEANRFIWPGPDLRPLPTTAGSTVAYGQLPYGLAEQIRLKFIELIKTQRVKIVGRTE